MIAAVANYGSSCIATSSPGVHDHVAALLLSIVPRERWCGTHAAFHHRAMQIVAAFVKQAPAARSAASELRCVCHIKNNICY